MSALPLTAPTTASFARGSERLRVLLVPDSIHWITGTIAKSIVQHNSWMDGVIISGPVLDVVAGDVPELFDDFDVVHFLCPYASRDWLPRLQHRIATVTSHHHVSDDWRLLEHNLNGDAIIVGSTQWALDVVARGADPDRVVRVPYGVDASQFVPPSPQLRMEIRDRLGIEPASKVVGFFAKFSSNEGDRKGTDVFVQAVRILGARMPSLAVLIVGPGWHALVGELKAAGIKCVWLPFVRETREMTRIYHALDFYWVTARVEGGPVTLLEAMSCGICCVTTPVGLARDIVQSGINGIVVPFDDAKAVATATLELAHDTDRMLDIGGSARETILESMDVSLTTQGVRNAYDAALKHFSENNAGSVQGSASPTRAVSQAFLRRVTMLEQLTWAEALILQHQRVIAYRIMMESWLQNPASTVPARYLLRNLLPPRLVAALVQAKGARAVPS